jgi:hypothetical protein
MIPMVFHAWARHSALVRAIYQGKPIVLVHRALRALGFPHLLGRELADLASLSRRFTPPDVSAGLGRRVLFVVPRNWRTHALFQVGVAQALALRGARCAVATCGAALPVCEVAWAEKEFLPRCARCTEYVRELAAWGGVRCFAVRDYRDETVGQQIEPELARLPLGALSRFEWKNLSLGAYAVPATRWRLRSHQIEQHPDGHTVLSGFIRSGAVWASGMERILDEFKPDVLVMLNGLFMEERVTWALAQARGLRCVFFERGRDAGTVFFSQGQSAPRYDVSKGWETVRTAPFPEKERTRARAVIERRRRGEQLVETYWRVRESDQQKISSQLELLPGSPMAVLYTNVVWDTAMQDRDTIFDGMTSWLRHSIELFRRHPEWVLVIRVHPAESQVAGRESYERVGDWVRREFDDVPGNVRLVLPETPIDSYALMSMAQAGLVYASTTGLELAVEGTPVVVAGDAHYRQKGFTHDPASVEEYDVMVTTLMQGRRAITREQQVDLALRYSHLFFLRRMYPMTVLQEPEDSRPRLAYDSPDFLIPGQSQVLDLICNGILTGSEFELPAVAAQRERVSS